MYIYIVGAFCSILIVLYVLALFMTPKRLDINGGHVIVTGGSSGIGKAVAVACVEQGASVTLLARNQTRLDEAVTEVKSHIKNDSQVVQGFSVDVAGDYASLKAAVDKAIEGAGPVDILVNSAGASHAGTFVDTEIADFERLIRVNYVGTIAACKAVIPEMMSRGRGRVVLVSSMAGQLGLFGYSAYSGSKFALRGFAEALAMETKPYGVYVTLSFPPDTDTPMLHSEDETKPEETRLISGAAPLLQPDVVANAMLEDALRGRFLTSLGIDGYLLTTATCGMAPMTSVPQTVVEIFTAGLCRAIGLFYVLSFDRIVAKCSKRKGGEKKQD